MGRGVVDHGGGYGGAVLRVVSSCIRKGVSDARIVKPSSWGSGSGFRRCWVVHHRGGDGGVVLRVVSSCV